MKRTLVGSRSSTLAASHLAAALFASNLLLPSCATAPTAPASAIGATAKPAVTAGVVSTGGTSASNAPAREHASRQYSDPVVAKIVELGRNDSQVANHLEEMITRFGPRLTGSHNLMAAEAWARDRFASFGLTAKLETWGSIPVGFDRGPASGLMISPERVELDFTTRAWTPGLFGPVRGPAVLYPQAKTALAELGERAKGAWIIHSRDERKLSKKLRKKIDDQLEKMGVAGHVLRAYDRKGKLVHTSGRYKISWNNLPHEVGIMLRGDQYDDIVKRIAENAEVVLEFSIDNRFFNGPVPQNNVIAEIPGTEKPDEYVIIGGHIDSWDGAQGVVDNGTGVATTLEAARLLVKAGAKPKRTIRFMLWSGEEQGLLGSEGYVKAHSDLADKTSVVLVHDGGTNYLSGLSVTPEMAADARKVFEPIFGLDASMPFGLYYAESLQPGGSDHNAFISVGVPGFFWHQSGKADYNHAHHTQYDTMEAVVPAYQKHSAMVVAIAALGFANLDNMLDRTDSKPLGSGRRLGVLLDGNKITGISPRSHAARLGMKAGDVIVKMNGAATKTTRDVVMALRSKGDKKTIVFKRGKRRRKVTLDFASGKAAAKIAARKARRKAAYGELRTNEPFAGAASAEDKAKRAAREAAEKVAHQKADPDSSKPATKPPLKKQSRAAK